MFPWGSRLDGLVAACGMYLFSFSPNKRSEEGFLLSFYRITFVDQDFLSPVAADLPRLA